jgi:hypothetical protein
VVPTPAAPALIGVDFSSAPSRRKPITVARGCCSEGVLTLDALQTLPTLDGFAALVRETGPWLGAFDFPFGLPREFVRSQALGATLVDVVSELQRRWPSRMAFRAAIDDWGNRRPAGQRLIHRGCDRLAPGLSSTSPLQTRYVPVGFMFYEGISRLLAADVHLPGLHDGDRARVALEGYPGLLAHELIGRRSYKNGDRADHQAARRDIVDALTRGATRLALRLRCSPQQRRQLLADAAGDHLDAVVCLMQAAWAQGWPGWGQPAQVDPLEGWICSASVYAPQPAAAAALAGP